jgi:hypothetical protein
MFHSFNLLLQNKQIRLLPSNIPLQLRKYFVGYLFKIASHRLDSTFGGAQ